MSRVRFLLSVANRFSFRGLVIGVVMAVLDALRAAGRGDARAFASSEPRARLLTGDEASMAVVKKERRDANTGASWPRLGRFRWDRKQSPGRGRACRPALEASGRIRQADACSSNPRLMHLSLDRNGRLSRALARQEEGRGVQTRDGRAARQDAEANGCGKMRRLCGSRGKRKRNEKENEKESV